MKRLLTAALLCLTACAPTFTTTSAYTAATPVSYAPREDAVPFTNYVAMGDSITAGFQSGGLTRASQRASYARLLGLRGGLDVVMPEVNDPGCPPPVNAKGEVNCTRRNPLLRTADVAVPGAKVHDVLFSTDTQVQNPDLQLYDPRVYRLILGAGTTQMDAALARKPKFVTFWLGSNDILLPTLRGRPDEATPLDAFRADYAAALDRLVGAGVAHIVVMTVPDVTRVPALLPARLLQVTGLVDASCQGQDVYFGSVVVGRATRERPLSCASPEALTGEEFGQAQRVVEAYNAAITELAAARGIPVFDVNAVLATLPGRPAVPNQQQPFGPSFSLDGVHPSDFAHQRFAQALAVFMNQQFGTSLDTQP